MNIRRSLSLCIALVGVSCFAARGANAAPAIAAFDKAFAGINDYTCVLHVHEAKGTMTQDRVYQYEFMKPHYVKTLILDGDGKGSGGVWIGGDQVSGHQGGFFSGIHLKISLHDPRAVSLRGVTIPEGLLPRIVDDYATIPGKLTQLDGGKIQGVRDRSYRAQGRRSGLEQRYLRSNSLRIERDALAGSPDHVLRLADRPRRKRYRPQNQRRANASRLPVLNFRCRREPVVIPSSPNVILSLSKDDAEITLTGYQPPRAFTMATAGAREY